MTLSKIAQQLDDARRDLDQQKRLQTAQSRVDALTVEYDAAVAQEDVDATAKALADREAQYAGITDVTVRDATPAVAGDGLLHRSFAITTTRPTYDSNTRQNPVKQSTVRGFHAVPYGSMLFLIDKRPENIPAAVMALAPDNPTLAFQRYAMARQRGTL